MATSETNLATTSDSGFLALANTDFTSLIAEELDGLDLSFERIKIPGAGGTMYETPGDDGEPEQVKDFCAVVLHHHAMNGYYKAEYTGGNQPPDCGSYDGATGVGDPGGDCKACPLNQYGTGKNGSKACKQKRRLYLLREGEVFPLLLSLPTCSLSAFTKYIKRLLGKGHKSNAVVTRFTLKRETNKTGVAYAQAQFAIARPLTEAERALVEPMTTQAKAYSQRVAFDHDTSTDDCAEYVDIETGEVIQPLIGGR